MFPRKIQDILNLLISQHPLIDTMAKDKLNILVTGANGQLGRSVRKESNDSNDIYFFTDIDTLDITDEKAVEDFIIKNDINVIVNCAAYTNVDAAEDNEVLAEKLNGEAPGILARSLAKRDGTLIHISTDYVFGGATINTPIKESEKPSPTGVYGLTKLHGEEKIEESGVKYLIFRTAWLYSDYGNNFVVKILSLLEGRDTIKVVFDQCGTPTYASDLAKAIVFIIASRKHENNSGIYHFSNEGVCSWYDFAEASKTIMGLTNKEVLPCHSSEFPSKVIRPPYSVLDKTKVKHTFGIKIPHWRESLIVMLSKIKNHHHN